MKRSKIATTAVVLIFLGQALASAQSTDVDVDIRFFDKSIYFPESDIFIRLSIANESGNTYRFRLAENRVFNVDFDVRTLTNVEVQHSQEFITERNADQPVFFREVSLGPGEQFSFVENLQNYVSLPGPGMYVVSARFYPELVNGPPGTSVSSPPLVLSVRPAVGPRAEVDMRIDAETGEVLQRVAMPPDQVVRYTLRARQRGQWERFFLYLDLESLYQSNPARERRYRQLSEDERRATIEDYRNNLRRETVDTDILVIPTDFQIVRTTYSPDSGSVVVDEEFAYDDYTEIKRYTYYVRRRDDVWEIYDYDVRNLGTQQ
jgi:hypothetical protein